MTVHCEFAAISSMKLAVDLHDTFGNQVPLWAQSFGVSMSSELAVSPSKDLSAAFKPLRKPIEVNLVHFSECILGPAS